MYQIEYNNLHELAEKSKECIPGGINFVLSLFVVDLLFKLRLLNCPYHVCDN